MIYSILFVIVLIPPLSVSSLTSETFTVSFNFHFLEHHLSSIFHLSLTKKQVCEAAHGDLFCLFLHSLSISIQSWIISMRAMISLTQNHNLDFPEFSIIWLTAVILSLCMPFFLFLTQFYQLCKILWLNEFQSGVHLESLCHHRYFQLRRFPCSESSLTFIFSAFKLIIKSTYLFFL